MKVLIIDDNALTRYTIKTLLLKLDHEVTGEAENGDDALKAYAELKPDVVFLDLILPGKSGVEILEDLLKLDPGAKVVIITAVEQRELDQKLENRGISGVIRKPFSFEEFREAVNGIARRLNL